MHLGAGGCVSFIWCFNRQTDDGFDVCRRIRIGRKVEIGGNYFLHVYVLLKVYTIIFTVETPEIMET
jgi:hypothetical protein